MFPNETLVHRETDNVLLGTMERLVDCTQLDGECRHLAGKFQGIPDVTVHLPGHFHFHAFQLLSGMAKYFLGQQYLSFVCHVCFLAVFLPLPAGIP